jgi:hypothetical protein
MSRFHRPLVLKNTPSSIPHALKNESVCVLQSEIHRLLEVSTQRIQALETMYSSAYQFINTQIPEITLSLHERFETYIKKLQVYSLCHSLSLSLSHTNTVDGGRTG